MGARRPGDAENMQSSISREGLCAPSLARRSYFCTGK
jgi:hypothetical protein